MRTRELFLALMTTAGLAGCGPAAVACPAIAPATAVSVTVPADYAPQVGTLRLKACQDGACKEDDVELHPGSDSIDQGCTPDGACSATASPNGTKVGMLMLDSLTEAAITVTSSGNTVDGAPLPVHTLEFRPRADHPFGVQCGKFLSAAVTLESSGLRERV
ncbi:hypothetical protein ACLH0K_01995 [Arthrobacter sp. MPF02]|uniref:hypothetical protein n=1 Tax=Arthrobacter sp. MPF02 TaxID=3388492 RepID=UPI0039852AF1